MKHKYYLIILPLVLIFNACQQNVKGDTSTGNELDSTQRRIENKVNQIFAKQDSLVPIPSLRFAKGADETYTATMYGENQVTVRIREEEISNEKIWGRDYFYHEGQLIFIKEQGSVFKNAVEEYTERLIYFNEGVVYKAYEKHQFTDDDMFFDTLFKSTEIDLADRDLEKPNRALQQKGEFTMYFDEFLLIEPQSYLIVENNDKSINAALYIVEGDSLLNVLFENPKVYKKHKIWVYHSFREMNGVERMIYEGAVLLKDN